MIIGQKTGKSVLFNLAPITTAADNIHLKHQALFSWKDKSKKLKCHLLQFLFVALRVYCWSPVPQWVECWPTNLVVRLESCLRQISFHWQTGFHCT